MLDAAEQLIRQRGIDGFTVADLVKRAESSVGSFYARFEDKEALVRVVQDRVMTRIEELLTLHAPTAWASPSLDECVLKFVNSIAYGVEEGPLFHAFLSQSTKDTVMRDRGRRFGRRLCELFRSAVAPHRAEIGHADPDLAIEFAYATCISVLERRLLWGRAAGSGDLDRPDLVRELARSVSAYLRSAESAKREQVEKRQRRVPGGKSAKKRPNSRRSS
jgi:AcrR family transcriptional regulator